MASLLIKGMKESTKELLKVQAQKNHRSMNKEAISILEYALLPRTVEKFSENIKFSKPPTSEEITAIIRHDRDHGHKDN